MEPPELLEVGRVSKSHGLLGEVVVDLWTVATERLDPGSVLLTSISRLGESLDSGSLTSGSLTVKSSRPHQGRWLVSFEGITNRSEAEALRGVTLSAPPIASPISSPGTVWVHELIGSQVVTTNGRELGNVVAVEPNPASDLLVLEAGELIPLCFMVGRGLNDQITVDIPEGLVD